jgi:hypothetical protein
MTSSTKSSDGPSPTRSTTWPTTKAGCQGATRPTHPASVEAIRRWWGAMGHPRFPDATKLLITANAGGSNGPRLKLWKVELAQLAAETGLAVTVCH